ncbi:DUF3047 domain-containing protein [Herbaspirillum sp. LeCh32-8]|uniref:DUF3047 domain-containing protein n=1 Tax=Herbaspirillum sp. LeCh32-8 TaxID=2821356 RepID=UPI001AE600DB|nr:DUF3047 domain-containing protein [Herbaspirillum sp. LeCh32-8]MBP0600444.1 DUF3047 domain-containing protein [Herbaspirillum sp. LeCh32-8]
MTLRFPRFTAVRFQAFSRISSIPARTALGAACIAGAVLLAGCAGQKAAPSPEAAAKQAKLDQALALFSTNPPSGLPAGWEPLAFTRKKKSTEYQLIEDAGRTVLRAYADQASSGLRHDVNIDVNKKPWLTWTWKTSALIPTADNTQRETEDSPVRIVLAFDGDHDKLSLMDTILFDTAKLLTGNDLPYATLMYIWENKAPVGTVIANTRTGRIQMMVAESGPAKVGQWVTYHRNVAEDYEKIFGEKPGKLIGVGVLTDTDNTAQKVEAWYGDIRLLREADGGE